MRPLRGLRHRIRSGGRWLLFATLLAACGSDTLGGEGATCTSSEECGDGLLCDFGKTPHVCSPTSTASKDMTVRLPDAGRDAHLPDLAEVD
jgi:hypothetical protein